MAKKVFNPTPEMTELLKKSGSSRYEESLAAMRDLAIALTLPFRQGVLVGDIVDGIFEEIRLAPGATPEFPLDIVAPGTEKNYSAFTIPSHGRIPENTVEGDFVMVPTFKIGNSIDWLLDFAEQARWDVVGRCMQVFYNGFTKKINDDGWHVVLAAGVDRNIVVYDSAASAGQFTKRLVSLMKTVMRRNGGGNSSSVNRGLLTDLFVSPEGHEDIRDWGVDQVDEITRREIYVAADGSISRIFGVNLHSLDELGEDQEYQLFYANELAGTLASSDVELVVGLDLSNEGCFVMPIRKDVEVFEDPTLHRSQRAGFYGWSNRGYAALDNRRVIVGSF